MTGPRDLDECETFADLLVNDPDTADMWFQYIVGLVPPHALRSSHSSTWRWTNRRGAWMLAVGKGAKPEAAHRPVVRPSVTLKRGWDNDCPDARWEVADLGVEHIRAVLIILGAIDDPAGSD
jgi:hypothetical protein